MEKAEKNMSVFFSYGHDCEEIVLKIKEDLEKYGFQIWMDRSEIKSGNEWREKITAGILNSDMVVAFLSSHALRKGGVCLNELSIAVGCKYGHIKTVLLEPNIESRIPATISDVQYCDMTKWRKMKCQDDETFYKWYDEKFQEILEVLSGKEAIEMENHLKYLEQMLSPAMWQIRQSRELKNNYIVRKSLEKSIAEWMKQDNASRFFMLYGEPGTGKSTFMINYHHYNYEAVAIAFCDWKKQKRDKNKEILRSISFQLAAKIPAYRTSLVWHLENRTVALSELSEDELFTLLFTEPWRNCIQEAGQRYLILIDGININNEKGNNSLANLLTEYSEELPQNIRFLISARKDNIITSYFSDCNEYEILPEEKENTELIKEYYRLQLYSYLEKWDENNSEKFLDVLTEKSEGNFLYAELLAQGIIDGKILPADLAVIPLGLSGIYRQWFMQLFPNEDIYYENYFIPLCILCAVDDPIPVELLRKMMGWNVIAYRKFLKSLKNFLRIQKNAFGKETVTLFHSSMLKWLLSKESGVFQVDSEEGIQTLKEQLELLFDEQEITPYQCKLLISVAEKSKDNSLKKKIYSSRYFFDQYILLAKAYESIRNGYYKAIIIYTHLKEIAVNFDAEEDWNCQKNSLSYCLGRCYCQIGDYYSAKKILEENIEEIEKYQQLDDIMEAWYILGSVYDWFGQREESLHMFYKLKETAELHNHASYLLKAMAGLIWNEHFNQIEEALSKLKQVSDHAELSKIDFEMCELIRARVMLSSGDLYGALRLYEKCLMEFDFTFQNDVRGYRKNRLLLIEILPGCYDNAQYEKGIETGKLILEKIKNTGWIEECYCISWIALNYLGIGDVDSARKYLKKALYLLESAEQTAKSQWISMHLLSVTALVLFEEGEYKAAIEKNQQVLEYALKCKDTWVAGDACYEILKIVLFYDTTIIYDTDYYYEMLNNLASYSGLLHLQLKRDLIQGLLGVKEENITKIIKVIRKLRQYAKDQEFSSTNKMEVSCIQCMLYQVAGETEAFEEERMKIMHFIRQPEYRERLSLKRLLEQNSENKKDYANFSVEYCDPLLDKNTNYWMKLEHLGRYLWARKICDELDAACVADIACATGYGCSILAQEAEQVIGIDRSYKYLDMAPKIENVTYICKNLDTIEASFCENRFDVIISFETLEHVKYPEKLIQSFSRMLTKNGTLLLSFPNSRYEKLNEYGENADVYHLHIFEKEEVEGWLKENGFEILEFLGQSYCNIRCQEEYNDIKAGVLDAEQMEKEHDCTSDELFKAAYQHAIPVAKDVECSYSYIFHCKKTNL